MERALVDGGWKGGRKQPSLGASREGRAEEVRVVRTGAPLRGSCGEVGQRPHHQDHQAQGPQSSADHGLHVCLPLKLILDLVCTS